MIHVVIAARSAARRRGLRALIESDGIRVVGEETVPSNGHASDRPRPDVLIVDGPEWLPARVHPSTSIVMIGDEKRLPGRLSGSGAHGWAIVPPDVSAELLRAAVTAAAQGMVVIPAGEAASGALNHGIRRVPDEHGEDDAMYEEALTSREREVLEGIADGLTNREIAGRLGISDHTVKFHISTIYGKLGASTRTEAVRRAVHRGLVTL